MGLRIEHLSRDLRGAFPGAQGFSTRNLWRMRSLYVSYTRDIGPLLPLPGVDGEFLPQAVAEIPWGHNILLLEKLDDPSDRLWYARKTVEHGWSRSVLRHQIDTRLKARSGRAVTNFDRALPDTDLARELLKDPYHFEFLQLGPAVQERDLERALLANVRDFLLELGVGFGLVGSQYRLVVGGQDFYVDLLFYHIALGRYVIVELKVGAFTPEDAGKVNFLPHRRGRAAPRGRAAVQHRPDPVQGAQPGGGRVRAAGDRETDRGGRVPADGAASRAPRRQPAERGGAGAAAAAAAERGRILTADRGPSGNPIAPAA